VDGHSDLVAPRRILQKPSYFKCQQDRAKRPGPWLARHCGDLNIDGGLWRGPKAGICQLTINGLGGPQPAFLWGAQLTACATNAGRLSGPTAYCL
jgi:hypothetical protein